MGMSTMTKRLQMINGYKGSTMYVRDNRTRKLRIRLHTADPGLVGVAPGIGVIVWPPYLITKTYVIN